MKYNGVFHSRSLVCLQVTKDKNGNTALGLSPNPAYVADSDDSEEIPGIITMPKWSCVLGKCRSSSKARSVHWKKCNVDQTYNITEILLETSSN